MEERTYTIRVTLDDDGFLFAEVLELPGCFASGQNPDELTEALTEALGMCLSDEGTVLAIEPLPLDDATIRGGDQAIPTHVELQLA